MDLYVPPAQFGQEPLEIERWFANIQVELNESALSRYQKTRMFEYYREVGLLRGWRRPFFHAHFSRNLGQSTEFLFSTGCEHPAILDLGAGMGTEAILFALMGALVVAVDLDEEALDVLETRKKFYENHSGRKLAIVTMASDIFTTPLETYGSFDGIYSLFAFNLMQPTSVLLSTLSRVLNANCRVAIQDGNCTSWLARLWPGRRRAVCSPEQLQLAFEMRGFTVDMLSGAIALPPACWMALPRTLSEKVDRALCRDWSFALSYNMFASRSRPGHVQSAEISTMPAFEEALA